MFAKKFTKILKCFTEKYIKIGYAGKNVWKYLKALQKFCKS